ANRSNVSGCARYQAVNPAAAPPTMPPVAVHPNSTPDAVSAAGVATTPGCRAVHTAAFISRPLLRFDCPSDCIPNSHLLLPARERPRNPHPRGAGSGAYPCRMSLSLCVAWLLAYGRASIHQFRGERGYRLGHPVVMLLEPVPTHRDPSDPLFQLPHRRINVIQRPIQLIPCHVS